MNNQESLDPIQIKNVPVDLILPLRQKFLLQHLALKECYYNRDFNENSLHLAAYLEGKIVGICSVIQEQKKNIACQNPWRLRGLAVEPEARGKKITHQLGLKALNYIAAHEGDLIWAYARPNTYGMYAGIGMKPAGEEFTFEDQGLHKLFVLRKSEIDIIKSNVLNLLSTVNKMNSV